MNGCSLTLPAYWTGDSRLELRLFLMQLQAAALEPRLQVRAPGINGSAQVLRANWTENGAALTASVPEDKQPLPAGSYLVLVGGVRTLSKMHLLVLLSRCSVASQAPHPGACCVGVVALARFALRACVLSRRAQHACRLMGGTLLFVFGNCAKPQAWQRHRVSWVQHLVRTLEGVPNA